MPIASLEVRVLFSYVFVGLIMSINTILVLPKKEKVVSFFCLEK